MLTLVDDDFVINDRRTALIKLFSRIGLQSSTQISQNYQEALKTLDAATNESEIDAKDLNKLYALSNAAKHVQKATPSDGFILTLKEYQREALGFMLSRERGNQDDKSEGKLSPIWADYTLPDKTKLYFSPFNGQITLKKPAESQSCLGGILADEMGLGKTIEMLSLIHSNRYSPNENQSVDPDIKPISATLIVCPVNVLNQWKDEAERAIEDVQVEVYHSSGKFSSVSKLTGSRAPLIVYVLSVCSFD